MHPSSLNVGAFGFQTQEEHREDAANAHECLRNLKVRGMNGPALVAINGAPGVIRAAEEVFPQSLRQRCLAHKLHNLGAKILEER